MRKVLKQLQVKSNVDGGNSHLQSSLFVQSPTSSFSWDPHDVFLAFLICSSFSILFHTQKAEAEARTMDSLTHCKKKCGEIDIPYPFGVKKGCYLDESFEIACNNSAGSATLPYIELEVDAISFMNHSLRVKNSPVINLPYNLSKESGYGHDYTLLLGSQLSLSHTKNRVVVIGCNFMAYILDGKTKDFVAGCASFCNSTDIPFSPSTSCSGQKCCQMNLNKDLTNGIINIDPLNTTTKSWKCGFFTFVDKRFPINKLNFSECEDEFTYTVPIILEWRVANTSCKKAVGRKNYVCGNNTDCIDSNIGMGIGYRCKCRQGFTGNPYILEGCQDIDECANSKDNNCPIQSRCVNTEGSYFCLLNRKRMSVLLISLGTGIAVGILFLVAICLWTWRKLKKMNDKKTKQRFFKRNGGLLLQQRIASGGANVLPESTLFKIEELEKATDKFNESRVLGKGGLGTVYKGMLSDGRIVAVKKANIAEKSQVGQFINEVLILSQISHRHIVKLLGCCLETEVPLLIYEYVSNGTLSNHIHDEPNTTISWEDRLRIAAEVAEALAYLHSYASTAIIHRDIKSSNILIDEKYKAVVSDFGLSRSVSIDRTHLTTLVGGTFGYLDPEYFRSGQLNDKSDVYAFAVVLAEILTGQKAISSAKDNMGLAQRFQSAIKEHRLFEILEKVVADEGEKDEILAVAKLAKRCLKVSARKRPSMKEVAAELDLLRKRRELPGHQESFCDEDRSTSEKCYTSGIDSEAEDDQTISKTN